METLENLKNSEIKQVIDARIHEFEHIGAQSIEEIFKEMCFCIMTANCGAEKCIEIHEGIRNGFLNLSQEKLADKFKTLGYRFPNIRSEYIIEARKYKDDLEKVIKTNDDVNGLRDWIVKNVKGLGYKETSHFLRNIGYKNYAIIDFHIINILTKNNFIKKPKTMTKKRYLEIEIVLKNIGDTLNLNMAELDLYLWYLETGKILK
ncbi:MAG: N-glycosylase/DNA lyase [Promethearchaeota archaeon]